MFVEIVSSDSQKCSEMSRTGKPKGYVVVRGDSGSVYSIGTLRNLHDALDRGLDRYKDFSQSHPIICHSDL